MPPKKKPEKIEEKQHISEVSLVEEVEEEYVDPLVFVGELVTELMDTVMFKITQVYLENLTINFVIDSYQKAVSRLVEIHFCRHPKYQPYHDPKSSWAADVQPDPSWPDTWAVNQVPIVSKSAPEEYNTVSQIEVTKAKLEGLAEVPSDVPVCDKDSVETMSVDLDFSVTKIVDRIVDQFQSNPPSHINLVEKTISTFDAIAMGTWSVWGVDPKFSTVSLVTQRTQLPSLDFVPLDYEGGLCSTTRSTLFSVNRLPPLRIDVDMAEKKILEEKGKRKNKRK